MYSQATICRHYLKKQCNFCFVLYKKIKIIMFMFVSDWHLPCGPAMETDGEQNQQGASTNGSASSGTSSRPSAMNSMSLYERQAVQVGGVCVCLCVCYRPSQTTVLVYLPSVKTLTVTWQKDMNGACVCVSCVFVVRDLFVKESRSKEGLTCVELMEAL